MSYFVLLYSLCLCGFGVTTLLLDADPLPAAPQAGRLGVREETGPVVAPAQLTSEWLGVPSRAVQRWGDAEMVLRRA